MLQRSSRRRCPPLSSGLVTLAALLSGCDEPSKPEPQPELGATLAVDLPVRSGRAGDRLTFTCTVTNGAATAQYTQPCCGTVVSVAVLAPHGSEYSMAPPVQCACPDIRAPLAPGQHLEETQAFAGVYYDPTTGERTEAAPGSYQLVCRFKLFEKAPGTANHEVTKSVGFEWLPPLGPASETEFVARFGAAYAARDLDAFDASLHPTFRFFLAVSAEDGTSSWDRTTELTIHRRMFRPREIVPPDAPLPVGLWLVSIDALLAPVAGFVERPEYYFDPVLNPHGLDPLMWRVTTAELDATVFFETQGDTDFRVAAREAFVVAIDRRKLNGESGKYQLLRWLERSALQVAAERQDWGSVKSLYR